MSFDDYKLVIYRNRRDGWVAEIPAIAGCHERWRGWAGFERLRESCGKFTLSN